MEANHDYIYVPKADINEGISSGIITKAALYFTKKYLFVVPTESLEVLLAGASASYENTNNKLGDLASKISGMDLESFENLLLKELKPERVYHISELEKFSIQVGFWIFGGIQIRRIGGPLQAINVQPMTLREEIKKFYRI